MTMTSDQKTFTPSVPITFDPRNRGKQQLGSLFVFKMAN